jgi:signal transduction histidine kinase
MKRLYLHVYLTIVASLVFVVAVAAGVWEFVDDHLPHGQIAAAIGELIAAGLGPADAPAEAQRAAALRLAERLRIDFTLYAADRERIAAAGPPLPPPRDGRVAWPRGEKSRAWSIRLPDGRILVTRAPWRGPVSGLGVIAILGGIAAAVALAAFPLARRITRRLERLEAGVQSFGAGDLSARVAVTGRDEVARVAAAFNHAAARIEALVRAHKSLLANASHELRTPLARLRMGIELLKQQADPKRKAELEADIAELDRLIDEILLASRLDAVAALETREAVDLLALAAEECARYSAATLVGVPATATGDPVLLRRLLRNLLENAAKYGVPPIEVRLAAGAATIELTVADHGPGVAAEDRARVFEPFFRTGASRNAGGAGLGLALVREIARKHGGDAAYLPTPDRASRFVVTLPKAKDGSSSHGRGSSDH